MILTARSEGRLRALADELDAAHGEGTALDIPLDVRDAGAWQRAMAMLPTEWSDIDIAVFVQSEATRPLVRAFEANADDVTAAPPGTTIATGLNELTTAQPTTSTPLIEQDENDTVSINYTSGTTARPSGSKPSRSSTSRFSATTRPRSPTTSTSPATSSTTRKWRGDSS